MHVLLQSDHAILIYVFHLFALCRGPKGGGHNTMPPINMPSECACHNGHSILLTA